MTERHAIDELVYRSCMLLDQKDFAGFLALCDPAFHYAITAYSPEIRKDMTWLDHDKAGLKLLFDNLPKHNSDHSPLTRQAIVYTVEQQADAGQVQVVSALTVYKTTLDGGITELFAVGKLHDQVRVDAERPLLVDRNVRLDTRMLGIGSHIPI